MTSLFGIKHQKKRCDAGLQQMDQLRAGLSNAAEYCSNIHSGCLRYILSDRALLSLYWLSADNSGKGHRRMNLRQSIRRKQSSCLKIRSQCRKLTLHSAWAHVCWVAPRADKNQLQQFGMSPRQ